LIAIFLRTDENIKILAKVSDRKPIEDGIEITQNSIRQTSVNKNDADPTTARYTAPTATISAALRKQLKISSSYAFSMSLSDSLMLTKTEKDADDFHRCLVRTRIGEEDWLQSEYLQKSRMGKVAEGSKRRQKGR
jgi:hypothetical protein